MSLARFLHAQAHRPPCVECHTRDTRPLMRRCDVCLAHHEYFRQEKKRAAQNERNRKRYATHRQQCIERWRANYAARRDAILAQQKEYRRRKRQERAA